MTPEVTKSIRYNRDTKDFDVYCAIDSDEPQYIGSASTYGQGKVLANEYAMNFYLDAHTPEKAVPLMMSNCLSTHVAAISYPAFHRFLTEIESLNLPDQLTDAIVLPAARLADELAAAIV